jgi:vesicle transport through interaction with t-SNAREs protein 1
MSEVFEAYERQYCELSTNLSRKCSSVANYPHDSEQKREKVLEINSGLDDADVLIRKMDLEARSLQPSVKAALLAKLREYKADLNRLKKEFKRVSSPDAIQSSREELLASGLADGQNVAADQRERLTMSVERLDQSSDRIKESRRTLLETEGLGISILEDLHQQRQTLLHSHNKLHGVNDAVDKSKKSFNRHVTQDQQEQMDCWFSNCSSCGCYHLYSYLQDVLLIINPSLTWPLVDFQVLLNTFVVHTHLLVSMNNTVFKIAMYLKCVV